ncbi:MAG: peptidase, partial [Nitrosopumilaceae archaeon]
MADWGFLIEYDLELLQNDSEIYSKHLVGTINSDPDEHKIKFDSQDVGSVNLVLSNIGGNSLATANFIFVIYPEHTIPDFPLTFQSMYESNGELVEGNFDVDVTWFPSSIEPGESEFVLTFYQTGTKIPVKNTTFDFILIQNNSQIFKTEGLAKSGGTFENYVFDENELGDVTVRIENIAGT